MTKPDSDTRRYPGVYEVGRWVGGSAFRPGDDSDRIRLLLNPGGLNYAMINKTNTKKRGFSLVELVIVVVIIGVIAAIAVPRISRGAKGAGESALRGSLAAMRNSIDMYAAEHNGAYPGVDGLAATVVRQLTEKTDIAGVAGTDFGPYLRRMPPVPVGPNAAKATGILMALTGSTAVDEITDATLGWIYSHDSLANVCLDRRSDSCRTDP